MYGHCWNPICLDGEDSGEESPRITVVLSMQYSGYCGPERLGVTCLRITGSGGAFIKGISAETLLADRGYDTNDILSYAVSAGMEPVIPPKKNRKEQRGHDKYLYKLRHLAENCFLSLKRWRGIATRYAKTSDAFIAAIHVRCIAIWAAIRA